MDDSFNNEKVDQSLPIRIIIKPTKYLEEKQNQIDMNNKNHDNQCETKRIKHMHHSWNITAHFKLHFVMYK